jgi:threonine synthase
MKYCSTRGGVSELNFDDAVMMGLAEDGGLLIPQELPSIREKLKGWRSLTYQDLCLEVLDLFVGESVDRSELKAMIQRSYASFRTSTITPVNPVSSIHVLELFHGPTFAFKDVALQLLGNLFESLLNKRGERLRILGATSGDTGSAAIHGVRHRKNLEIFMLHPFGRVSPIQELQMVTVTDENVHNLAVDGTFDDAQNIVKALFNDVEFKKSQRLGAVNSINWARVLAQIVYYIYAHCRVAPSDDSPVIFSVPTGNFGNVLAGYYAQQMGLPVEKLIVATNSNDILHRLFSKGEYHQEGVRETLSPSMDIQISSNLERYLYDLCDQDPKILRSWMTEFQASGKLTLTGNHLKKAQAQFESVRVDDEETVATIREVHSKYGYLLDPHSAVGYAAARTISSSSPVISLACAHPAKFAAAIERATGNPPPEPSELDNLRNRDTRCHRLPATSEAVRDFLEKTVYKYD